MKAKTFPQALHTRIVKLLAKRVNQDEIAKQVGVTRYYVSKINCGWIPPYPKAKPGNGSKKTAKRATPKKMIKKAAKKRAGTRKAAKRRSRR